MIPTHGASHRAYRGGGPFLGKEWRELVDVCKVSSMTTCSALQQSFPSHSAVQINLNACTALMPAHLRAAVSSAPAAMQKYTSYALLLHQLNALLWHRNNQQTTQGSCVHTRLQQALAVLPLPTASGEASEVKLAWLGTQVPSGRLHAGCGQWQKPGNDISRIDHCRLMLLDSMQ